MAAASGSVLVFGGRGLVGTAVSRELAQRGVRVLSLGRSAGSPSSMPGVEYHGGVDALRPETFEELLPGARAVVISIGEPPWVTDKERAMRANGLTNINVLRAAAKHKVPKAVLVNATMPSWRLIAGYREGKQAAEEEARRYPENCGGDAGVLILKPSIISGTRYAGAVPVPLWLVFEPVRFLVRICSPVCRALESRFPNLFGGVLQPPARAEELAAAAADAIQDPNFRGVHVAGVDSLVGYSHSKAA